MSDGRHYVGVGSLVSSPPIPRHQRGVGVEEVLGSPESGTEPGPTIVCNILKEQTRAQAWDGRVVNSRGRGDRTGLRSGRCTELVSPPSCATELVAPPFPIRTLNLPCGPGLQGMCSGGRVGRRLGEQTRLVQRSIPTAPEDAASRRRPVLGS